MAVLGLAVDARPQHPVHPVRGEHTEELRASRSPRPSPCPRASPAPARPRGWRRLDGAGQVGALTPSIGSRYAGSIGVTPSRRRPRLPPTNSETNSSAGAPRIAAGSSYCARRPPAAKTATLSPIFTASSMSWVTSSTVLPSSRWSRRNSSCSRPRTTGSTAPNGSSISSTGGSAASARATPTRWRWPPESWCGNRSANTSGSSPTSSISSIARAARVRLGLAEQGRHGGHVGGDRLVREQPDLLDHVADPAAQLDRVGVGDVGAVEEDPARSSARSAG